MLHTTAAQLRAISPRGKTAIVTALALAADDVLARYAINAKALRLIHFWSEGAHESDGFRTLKEYASGAAYEWRKDLGNVYKGDGKRFKGRSMYQLTGRANYRRIGKLIGIDLEKYPERAEEPEIAVLIAAVYWAGRNLNALADRNDFEGIMRAINGGTNGRRDRWRYFGLAAPLWKDPPAVMALADLEERAQQAADEKPPRIVLGPMPIAPTAPFIHAVMAGDLGAHPGSRFKIGVGIGIACAVAGAFFVL